MLDARRGHPPQERGGEPEPLDALVDTSQSQRPSPWAPLGCRALPPGAGIPMAAQQHWSRVRGQGEHQSIPGLCRRQRRDWGPSAVPSARRPPRGREGRAGAGAHMMVQEESGLRMWQVQAAPQYWRKVW